jgi:hypothetical protein
MVGNTIQDTNSIKNKVMYHGSPNQFDEFDKNMIGSNSGNKGLLGEGFYFTDKKSLAEDYANGSRNLANNGNGMVYEANLDVKNPLYWNSIKTPEQMSALAKELGLDDGILKWNKNNNGGEMRMLTGNGEPEAVTNALKKAGYDGVVYQHYEAGVPGATEVAVFEPEQISRANQTPTTLGGWMKQAGKRIVEDANNRGVGMSIKNVADEQTIPQDIQNMRINRPSDSEMELARMPQAKVNRQSSEIPTTKTMTDSDTQPFMAYGESELANRTGRGMVADALERFGNTLEGAQTNVTRAARKDIGVKNTGQVIENVRKKTGLTNMETQAQFAKELTGGENSLLDRIQNNSIYTREDGLPYRVDTTPVIDEVDAIVNKYADSNTFGSQKAKEQFIYNLKTDISNDSADVLGISNRMKATAADLRGKGVGEVPPKDKAQSRIYSEIADKLDDLSYSVIPQENVDNMFGAAINEMRARAVQATNKRNKTIAEAWNKAADALDAQPRTVKAFRSFKKDFVDVSKIDDLSAMAENGAAAQMGRSFGGGVKRLTSTLMQRPVNALLAKAGGAVNDLASKVSDTNSVGGKVNTVDTPVEVVNGAINNPSTRIYDMIGRTEGLSNAEQARTADYLVNAAQEAEIVPNTNAGTLESMMAPSANTGSTSVYNSMYGGGNQTANTQSSGGAIVGASGNSYFPATGDYWTDVLAKAMTSAIDADDVEAFASLYAMYQDAASKLSKSSSGKDYSDVTNWNTSDRTKLLGAQDAMSQIDQLEQAYNNATGGNGGNVLQGNLRSFASNISGGNLDPSANNYNKLAESVGMGIVKNLINLGVTEADAKRYLEYLPALTDTKDQAAQKLSTLRNIYQSQINNLYSAYGV